jgi:Phosphodiester glycosidase
MGLTQSGPLKLFTFAPSQLRIVAQPYAGNADPRKTTPLAPADVLGLSGALAALNGPFFDTANGDSADYSTTPYELLLTRHLDTSSGIDVSGSHPGDGATISVVNGTASILSGNQAAPGASVAIQGWPTLVRDGSAVASNDGQLARRAALAIMPDGQLALVSSQPLTLAGFAQALSDAGAVSAVNMDGGGSTSLVTPGAVAGSRRVASWLAVMPESSGIWFAALGVAAVAGILWATTHMSPGKKR